MSTLKENLITKNQTLLSKSRLTPENAAIFAETASGNIAMSIGQKQKKTLVHLDNYNLNQSSDKSPKHD